MTQTAPRTNPEGSPWQKVIALMVIAGGCAYYYYDQSPAAVQTPVPAAVTPTPVAAPAAVVPTPAPPTPPQPVFSPEGLELMAEYKARLAELQHQNAELKQLLRQTQEVSVNTENRVSDNEASLQNEKLKNQRLCSYLATVRDFPTSGLLNDCR